MGRGACITNFPDKNLMMIFIPILYPMINDDEILMSIVKLFSIVVKEMIPPNSVTFS